MRKLAIGALCAVLGAAPAHALNCLNSAPGQDENPRFEARIIEITPRRAAPIEWRRLHVPSLKTLPPVSFDSEPGAYAADIYAATLSKDALDFLDVELARMGSTTKEGPIYLSAPWCWPARYRQSRALTYVAHQTIPSPTLSFTEVTTGNTSAFFEITVTGSREEPQPQTLVRLSWQQVTGWLTAEKPIHLADVQDKKQRMLIPLTATCTLEYGRVLLPGEVLLLGGIQRNPTKADSAYSELAIVLRMLPH